MSTAYARTRYPGIRTRINSDGSRTYAIQVRLKGFPEVRETRGTLAEAVRRRDQIKRELREGLRPQRGKRTVREMVQRYLDSPAWAELRASTKQARLDRLEWWLGRIGDLQLMAVTPDLIAEHRDTLRAGESRRVSGPTSNRYVGALSSVDVHSTAGPTNITILSASRTSRAAGPSRSAGSTATWAMRSSSKT